MRNSTEYILYDQTEIHNGTKEKLETSEFLTDLHYSTS